MRSCLPALVALSSCLAASAAAELRWPLDQPAEERALSSSFCEDRGSHLHGGVDMSTGGEVGVPVLAAADGTIVRVKVKYRGLGRALYVQHAGGLMSVYGHLAGFAEPVRSNIDALIARKGLYPGDWYPDEPIPVKAGQVIAWSGKTGGGPPHLHFETRRNGGNRPVDPWAEGLPCIDKTPPIIDAISVHAREALDLRSQAEGGGGWREHVISLPRTDPILLKGDELLRLRVRDPFGAGTGFVRGLTVSIGDWELYSWDAASYTYAITRYAGHAFSRAAPVGADPTESGSWVWLHVWPGGGLPFVKGRSVLEAWDFGEPGSSHELTLRAWDGCGNESVSKLLVRVPEPVAVDAPVNSTGKLNLLVVATKTTSGGPVGPDALGEGHSELPPVRVLAAGRDLDVGTATARLHVPSGASETPTPVALVPFGESSLQLFPAPKPPGGVPKGLRRHGPPVFAGPPALPLALKAKVFLRGPESVERSRLGVYRWNPASERWQFWGDNLGSGSEVGTTTDRLGTFALLEDLAPPSVLSVTRRPVRGQPWRADAEELVVRHEEVGEGVSWDGVSFRPSAGGEDWIGVHDPDLAETTFTLPDSLVGRPLRGTLRLEDLAGHVVEIPVNSTP